MSHYDSSRPGYCPSCGAAPGNFVKGKCEFCEKKDAGQKKVDRPKKLSEDIKKMRVSNVKDLMATARKHKKMIGGDVSKSKDGNLEVAISDVAGKMYTAVLVPSGVEKSFELRIRDNTKSKQRELLLDGAVPLQTLQTCFANGSVLPVHVHGAALDFMALDTKVEPQQSDVTFKDLKLGDFFMVDKPIPKKNPTAIHVKGPYLKVGKSSYLKRVETSKGKVVYTKARLSEKEVVIRTGGLEEMRMVVKEDEVVPATAG